MTFGFQLIESTWFFDPTLFNSMDAGSLWFYHVDASNCSRFLDQWKEQKPGLTKFFPIVGRVTFLKEEGAAAEMTEEEGAAAAESTDREWVEQVKHGGALPLMNLDSCSNGWSCPPGECFRVRGPDYFNTRLKIPAGEWLLEPLAFDWIKNQSKVYEILKHPQSRVAASLKRISESCSAASSPFVWAFNLQVPSKENHSAVFYFVSFQPFPADSLVDRFLKGDDAFKNSRLKLIANIVKGPWIVKTAVGEQAICILGRALTCRYSTAQNFIEVDVDIGSSMVANAIVHLAIGYITSLTVDLAFLIEGQQPEELPEQILGAVRFGNLELQSAVPLDSMSAENLERRGSFGSRWWRFATFLKPGGTSSEQSQNEDTP